MIIACLRSEAESFVRFTDEEITALHAFLREPGHWVTPNTTGRHP